MADAHRNFASSLVATAPSPATSGTSLVVTTGEGTKFPTAPFNATIWPTGANPTTANAEIVRVTAVSTDTLTITRAQEGTSARTVIVGDQIVAGITAKALTDVEGMGTGIGPSDAGYLAWNIDPALLGSSTTQPTTGSVYAIRVPVPTAITVTAINFYFQTAGTGLTSGQNLAGIFNSAGTRLVVSADQSAAWAAASGAVTSTAVSSTALAAGTFVWVAILCVGTTTPQLRGPANGTGALLNAGFSAATSRFARISTGATSIPSSFTPSTLNQLFPQSIWCSLS